MASHGDIVDRWVQIALGKTTKRQISYRGARVIAEGDSIFSYGSHFEMARLVRDKKGQPELFLVNGDTFSVTTSGHQSMVRGAIAGTGIPSVIIPHRALRAAGIRLDSVKILHVTPDTHERREIVHYEQPQSSIVEWAPVECWNAELSWQEYRRRLRKMVDDHNKEVHERWESDQAGVKRMLEPGAQSYLRSLYAEHEGEPEPQPVGFLTWRRQLRGWDYSGTGKSKLERLRTSRRVTHYRRVCWTNASRKREWEMEFLPDGRTKYTRETYRHWLGESLISGEVTYQITKTCKGCKGTGSAEGPVPATWNPPTEISAWVGGFEEWPHRRRVLTGEIKPGHWVEDRWHRPLCLACDGRGRWSETRTRRSKFLSGFDSNETRPSYFFCELPPRCKATTVAEAYEALKPDTVKLAEQMGRQVERQGDIFAIPLNHITKTQLRKSGARIEKRGQLFGTNHVATEAAYLPDGTTIVRGVLHHVPEGRRPDHRRVKLADGKKWYVVQKNTVPLAA